MEWHHPQALYLILPMSLIWIALAFYSDSRRKRAREAFVAQAMWERILPEPSRYRFWSKLLLRLVAIIASLMAIAGPRFGTEYEQIIPRGSDLYVLIDVSRSMLAEDVAPSRLGRAKSDVASLVNRLEGERVGLIAFAGQAVVKCPMTVDYDSFRRSLQELDPNSAPRGGTAIGDAIRKALEVFQANAERDQAILLITDGDDQQSYPLEAAEVAAERKVTIFTVGLGDANQGSRIPQKTESKGFVEYQGEQVWSKLDGSLLSEIAMKTSGIYVPAGTRSYDLGELYTSHLQNRKGKEGVAQQRLRATEQFQWFLAMAWLALMLDSWIASYRRSSERDAQKSATILKSNSSQSSDAAASVAGSTTSLASSVFSLALFFAALTGTGMIGTSKVGFAEEPHAAVRQGMQLYRQEKFDAARSKFSAATEALDKKKSTDAASIAIFDEACAYHRQGEVEKARDSYLRSGLSLDRTIASASHFNLGNLNAEKARGLAGENPEKVEPDKRKEIIDNLMQAASAYRHALELKPDHPSARRNLELVRTWIKYYNDRWNELDRQKRRDESNLMQFLEFLITTQTSLKDTVGALPSNASADSFAELKRLQDELIEEIPTLREKIDQDLRPPSQDPNAGSGSNSTSIPGQAPTKEQQQQEQQLEEGIKLLQSWADAAKEHMQESSKQLAKREANDAVGQQQQGIDQLDKIWDAVVPFHPLLAKELAEQTSIAKSLAGSVLASEDDAAKTTSESEASDADKRDEVKEEVATNQEPTSDGVEAGATKQQISESARKEWLDKQERTLRKSTMLGPKAEMELKQMENAPTPPAPSTASPVPPKNGNASTDNAEPSDTGAQQVDPEKVKEGYRKAIELAPKAVEEMERAIQALRKKEEGIASQAAEEARRILQEIQDAQPKNPQQNQDQQNKDQQNKDQNDENQDKKDQKDKQDQDPKDQQDKKEDEKKDESKKEDAKKDEKKPDSDKDQKPENGKKPKVSQDRMEEALRKVREREQEKRDRDRRIQAQVLGRTPVDKDW